MVLLSAAEAALDNQEHFITSLYLPAQPEDQVSNPSGYSSLRRYAYHTCSVRLATILTITACAVD